MQIHVYSQLHVAYTSNYLACRRIRKNKSETTDFVGTAVLYEEEGTNVIDYEHTTIIIYVLSHVFVGHCNVRETIQRQLARDTPITFRKKRAPSTTEKRTPPSRATPSGTDIRRGTKRRATGSVVPSRKVLQLHNYFSKVD